MAKSQYIGLKRNCPFYDEKGMVGKLTRESITKKAYASENLPPAFAEAASRRQVAPLC
jgi:hypothetical protein